MKHPVGAQTIVWGEDIKENIEHILSYLSEQGYTGVETGMRHFDPAQTNYYRELYAAFGLTPLGIHSGGTFWDPEQAGKEVEKIGTAIDFASSVGFSFLVMSGNPQETPASMKESARQYAEIGKRCRDAGVQMAYHNHNWELKDNGAIIDVLMDETSEQDVSWVLDTAWARIAGMDLESIVSWYGKRIPYFHIKDVREETFCELGSGELDVPGILKLADTYQVEWLVVEQDYTSFTPEESMNVNIEYLRNQGAVEV